MNFKGFSDTSAKAYAYGETKKFPTVGSSTQVCVTNVQGLSGCIHWCDSSEA